MHDGADHVEAREGSWEDRRLDGVEKGVNQKKGHGDNKEGFKGLSDYRKKENENQEAGRE